MLKMNLLSNNNYNLSYPDIFCSFGPLPKNINLLDKEEIIQYKGIRIPRIPLGNNDSLNLSKLLYNTYQLIDTSGYSNDSSEEGKNISKNNEITLNNHLNDKRIIIKECNSKPNNIWCLCEESNLFHQFYLNHKEFEKEKSNNFIPPDKFIVILDKYINNNDNKRNSKEKYNDINNIILNNINNIELLYYNNINKAFPTTFFQKINTNNNSTIVDYCSQSFLNLSNYELDSISNLISMNLNENKSDSKILFEVKYVSNWNKENEENNKTITKRGRKQTKSNNENTRVHKATDDDNILRKIQVHFLSFTTNYINDIIKVFIIDRNMPFFKKIDYSIKKTVKHRYVECLKSMTIGEILQLRASSKMKIHDESVNRNIYKKVCSLCPFMKFYLQRNIITLFKEYYFNKSKIFIVNGKVIPLSLNTKTFNDLINKNYAYKEKFKTIAINYFLSKHKNMKKPNFIINNNLFGKDGS